MAARPAQQQQQQVRDEPNFAEGNLGRVYNDAQKLSLPEVAQLLRAKRDYMQRRDGPGVNTPEQIAVLNNTLAHAEQLVEFGAVPHNTATINLTTHRLRKIMPSGTAHPAFEAMNADDEGQPIFGEMRHPAPILSVLQPLLEFEAVMVATLMPRTTEEAVALIPSLRYYNEADLQQLLDDLKGALF